MEREYFLGEVYTFAELCNSGIRRTGIRTETARKKSASGTAFPCTYMPLKLTIANFFVFARFLEENRLERPIRQNLDMPEGGRAKRAPRSSGNLPYIETYEDFMRAPYSDTQKIRRRTRGYQNAS